MITTSLRLIARRSLAHLRLLVAVIAGIVLAVAIMSATLIYFDSLRNLALEHALERQSPESLDVVMQASTPTGLRPSHDAIIARVDGIIDGAIGDVVGQKHLAVKTATFDFEPISEVSTVEDGKTRRVAFVTFPGIGDEIRIVEGSPAGASTGTAVGGEFAPEIVIPKTAADAFDLSVGERFTALPFWDEDNPAPTPLVAGIFERVNPDSEFWRVYDELFAFNSSNFSFAVSVLDEASFVDGLAAHMPNMTASYGWTLDIDPERIEAAEADRIVGALSSLKATLNQDTNAYRQITGLDSTLADFETRLFFNRLPMIIVMILVVLVVLYYAVTLASLLVDAQREEISLLRTRGSSSTQIVAVFAIEAGVLSLVAVALGPPIAALAVKYAGVMPWFNDLNGGQALPVRLSWAAYQLAALGGVFSFLALFYPAFKASRVGLLTHRSRTGRSTGPPAFQRYYLDVAALGVGVILLAQLQSRGSVAAENLAGEKTVDQVTLAFPALFLVVAGLVMLRLFPLMMEVLARLFSSRMFYRLVSPTMVLGLWTMARNPAHYSRLSLLFILTAGLGVFSANFGATLDRSANDQALYATGADVRVTNVAPRPRQPGADIIGNIDRLDAVHVVSRVMQRDGAVNRAFGSDGYRMVGVDPDNFADVAWSRSDMSSDGLQEKLDSIRVETQPGISLPDGTRFLSMRIRPSQPTPGISVIASYRDENGRYSASPVGTLEPSPANVRGFSCPAPGHSDLSGEPLQPDWCTIGGSAGRVSFSASNESAGLNLLAFRFSGLSSFLSGEGPVPAGTILIDEISAVASDGTVTVIESFDDADARNRWSGTPLLPAFDDEDRPIQGAVRLSWGEFESNAGFMLFAGLESPPVPVLASTEFMERSGRSVGDVMGGMLESESLTMEIVDVIDFMPTVDPNQNPFIVADIDAVLAATNRFGAFRSSIQYNELWISAKGSDTATVADQVVAQIDLLPYSYSGISDRDSTLGEISSDPLVRAGWSVLLALAYATVLLVSAVGFLVHSQVSFDARKGEFALLRTIGLSMRQLLSLVVLEQVLVLGVAIGIGIFMGTRLGGTMLPFLSNSGEGVRVVPPILVEIDWPSLGITFAMLGAVILIVVAVILYSVYRMSIQSVLRLGER
ncbi:MAG: FtsX-like permease family protein [Chloroflexi bacterium]|nr:FtsX-like permease family protein [Chloroflexota bacterium]MBT4072277.1 FtsX-like permease family protein [Chloroflexota bacterium]MBT6680579.1 FtsX-like permease family protein [Chloroflexota bacterium]